MKKGLEEKRKEIVRLLSSFVELRADIHYVPEQMSITVVIPPPWSDTVEPEALAAQNRIREWSE